MLPPMKSRGLPASVLLALLIASPGAARVKRVELTSRADVLDGRSYGAAGAYERITGRVYFSVAVGNSHNRRIVDLANAVNLEGGEVEFSAEIGRASCRERV